jgi:hypothetical protein
VDNLTNSEHKIFTGKELRRQNIFAGLGGNGDSGRPDFGLIRPIALFVRSIRDFPLALAVEVAAAERNKFLPLKDAKNVEKVRQLLANGGLRITTAGNGTTSILRPRCNPLGNEHFQQLSPSRSRRYLPLVTRSTQAGLFRYQATVSARPAFRS